MNSLQTKPLRIKKKDIFTNAANFLRLATEEVERHHKYGFKTYFTKVVSGIWKTRVKWRCRDKPLMILFPGLTPAFGQVELGPMLKIKIENPSESTRSGTGEVVVSRVH